MWLIPLIPLLGAAFVWLFCSARPGRHALAGWIATAAALGSFAIALQFFFALPANGEILSPLWHWFTIGGASIEFALRFDRLSALMCLIITGVGSLIHLYAIGYMAEDQSRPRFFSYLNLFLFAMLVLVLGDSLPLMFVGWEGVGLCSYLLIGFWFENPENAKAGQKAFIVNRIGDAGFIIGMFTLLAATGSLTFSELVGGPKLDSWTYELAAFCLFIGAMGKSAQIPLYVWLPDAMAGPTPVSALIHAATMVTAGVYMMARMEFVYSNAPITSTLIMSIGALTAFFAATIALVQNDIKKVLAYSTVSQLGYMFMAMGAGAYSMGMFHVTTHAFFKACLFMGAGSVIIGCHHEQDLRHFGGLWKKMPLTFITYLVATLAIAGIPPLSGFFSKDLILWSVFSDHSYASKVMVFEGLALNQLLWGLGLLTAFLTAFYMTRSLVLTFFGNYRGHAHPHESPWVVTLPLIVLAFLSAGFGYLAGHDFLHYLEHWTRKDLVQIDHHDETYHQLELISIIVAAAGFLLAFLLYAFVPQLVAGLARSFRQIYRLLLNKWWVDEFYEAVIVRPLTFLANLSFAAIDRGAIDGTVNGVGNFVDANGEALRAVHTGRLQQYAAFMFVGLLLLAVVYLLFSGI
ncbi:NADH-quinone oxidoreductase subunit L [bacterium]|nr:NADH-quinone oxidoreductase subunit L [bacterium]